MPDTIVLLPSPAFIRLSPPVLVIESSPEPVVIWSLPMPDVIVLSPSPASTILLPLPRSITLLLFLIIFGSKSNFGLLSASKFSFSSGRTSIVSVKSSCLLLSFVKLNASLLSIGSSS